MPALNGLSEEGCRSATLNVSTSSAAFLNRCEQLAGLVLLIASTPVLVVSAIGLGVAYRRSPLIAHRRVGQNLEPFWMLKLRTMEPNETHRGSMFTVDRMISTPRLVLKRVDDHRVSNGFAAFCRRHSIDELPQLLHVVSGRMSLIGPRPLTSYELEQYYGSSAEEVFAVKPGLTGLWQIQGRSYLTMPERLALDLELVRSVSWRGRISIILRTILAVYSGKGAW